MSGTAMIYGATGYIGRLCARRATAAGARPVDKVVRIDVAQPLRAVS
jgi:short subunit dehydrogenase-like uncharacterized protein